MPGLLENMLRPVNVPVGSGGNEVVRVQPSALRLRSGKLDVVVVDPHEPDTVAESAGDIIDIIKGVIDIADKIFGGGGSGGGGGGGGGGQKCTSKLTHATMPDGTVVTTIETVCSPA